MLGRAGGWRSSELDGGGRRRGRVRGFGVPGQKQEEGEHQKREASSREKEGGREEPTLRSRRGGGLVGFRPEPEKKEAGGLGSEAEHD